ncbi:MogA/MoaB family molybdenum cofactor biosynthesis protein [soil metagenome]
MIRTALLTVSDRTSSGEREDRSVQGVRELLAKGPFVEVDYLVVPDEQAMIRSKLRLLSDVDGVDLVLTTGGTGLGPRDRTPEATLDVIERLVPGLAERMRSVGAQHDPKASLSRAVVGIRRATLVVNLPGDGAVHALGAVIDVLPHALAAMRSQGTAAAPAER